MEIGTGPKELRRQKGLTLAHLAARVGCSKSFLSRVENVSSSPSLAMLVKIIQSLGLTLHSFFNEMEGKATQLVRVCERQKFETRDGRSSYELLASNITNVHPKRYDLVIMHYFSRG